MRDERIREIIEKLAANHRRSLALVEEAQAAVSAATRIYAYSVEKREQRRQERMERHPDPVTVLADVRQCAQRARGAMEERRQLLDELAALLREAS